MRRKSIIVLTLLAFALMAIAGSCDVEKKRVKLVDLDKSLKKYQGKKWDGLKKTKVQYAVTGNDSVDAWSKQAGVTYASLIQAEHVIAVASKDLEKLKQEKNSQQTKNAKENVKLAQDILAKAVANAPKLVADGEALAKDYKSIAKDATKAPQIATAMKDSLGNLADTIKRGPTTIKKLAKIAKQLAKL